MIFEYVALSAQKQSLKGKISADNEKIAKDKLRKMGLATLRVKLAEDQTQEVSDEDTKKAKEELMPVFEFWVIDTEGKELNGSIKAKDRKNAFRRLIQEYQFEIISLCEDSVPPEKRQEKGKDGLLALAEEVEIEFGVQLKKKKDSDGEVYDDKFKAEKEAVLNKIKALTEQVQIMLKKHDLLIPVGKKDDIEKVLSSVMRLRFSNNIQLLRKLIEDLTKKTESIIKEDIVPNIGKDQHEKEGLNALAQAMKELSGDQFDALEGDRGGILKDLKKLSGMLKDVVSAEDEEGRSKGIGALQNAFKKWKNKREIEKRRLEREREKARVKDMEKTSMMKNSGKSGFHIDLPKGALFSLVDEIHMFLGSILTFLFVGVFLALFVSKFHIFTGNIVFSSILEMDIIRYLSLLVFISYFFTTLSRQVLILKQRAVFSPVIAFSTVGILKVSLVAVMLFYFHNI